MHKSGQIVNERIDSDLPPTGVYSSDDTEYVTTTYTCSKKTDVVEEKNSGYESWDDDCFQVTFPVIELVMPTEPLPRHHRRRHHSKVKGASDQVTVTKHVDRKHVYGESDCKDTISEYTTYTYSSHPDRSTLQSPSVLTDRTAISKSSGATDATYRTYNSQHRLQSIGTFFTSIIDFFRNNPNFSKLLFGVIMCYVVVCNLEVIIPRIIAVFVRLCYPWARYMAVVAEQFFSMIANIFTRMDAVIFASYCEFAAKYCRSRRLMCDVTCSFVDHVLSQARPTLSPIPQN